MRSRSGIRRTRRPGLSGHISESLGSVMQGSVSILLLNTDAAAQLKDAGVDREVRGREHASDHAPVWIEIGPA